MVEEQRQIFNLVNVVFERTLKSWRNWLRAFNWANVMRFIGLAILFLEFGLSFSDFVSRGLDVYLVHGIMFMIKEVIYAKTLS